MANVVVTQIMFRRFDLTTGKVLDASGAFVGLTVLLGLLCCPFTGSFFPWRLSSKALRHSDCLSLGSHP